MCWSSRSTTRCSRASRWTGRGTGVDDAGLTRKKKVSQTTVVLELLRLPSVQILLVMAKQNGTYVGAALNFFDGEALYGRNWGCTRFVPFLHFEACYYQAIDYAIAKQLSRVEAGAQGGHKLLRGYLPRQTYSAHYIAHRGLRHAVADYLESERAAVAAHMTELSGKAPFKKVR